jgi:PAS domain S-box-containing protein
MSDQEKTKEQLLIELGSVRARLASLERAQQHADESAKGVSGFFMGLLQYAPTPIYVKATDGRFMLVNKAWEDLFGLRQEAVVGRHVSEVVPQEVAAHFTRTDQQVIQTKTAFSYESIIPLPAGPRNYYTVKFPLLDAAGRVKAVGGVSPR